MRRAIDSKLDWFPSLGEGLNGGWVKSYISKNEALKAAKKCGWGGKVLRVRARLGLLVWIVGSLDGLPTKVLGITTAYDTLRVPMQRYEKNSYGVEVQPVADFQLKDDCKPWVYLDQLT